MFLACMGCLISLYGFSQSKTTTIRIKNNSTWEPVLEYLPTGSEGFEENKMNKKIILKSATIIQYTIKGRFMSR